MGVWYDWRDGTMIVRCVEILSKGFMVLKWTNKRHGWCVEVKWCPFMIMGGQQYTLNMCNEPNVVPSLMLRKDKMPNKKSFPQIYGMYPML